MKTRSTEIQKYYLSDSTFIYYIFNRNNNKKQQQQRNRCTDKGKKNLNLNMEDSKISPVWASHRDESSRCMMIWYSLINLYISEHPSVNCSLQSSSHREFNKRWNIKKAPLKNPKWQNTLRVITTQSEAPIQNKHFPARSPKLILPLIIDNLL